MTTFDRIKQNRRIVAVSAILVIALAAVMATFGAFSDDGPGVLQAIATVAMIVLPAIFALISLDRRPSLLPAAVMAALVSGVLVLEFLPVWLVVAIVWGMVVRGRTRPAAEPRWAWLGRPLLAAAVALPMVVMFVHLDPVCTTTYTDGRVEQVDPASHGYPSGWRFNLSAYTTGSESVSGVATEACSSDTVMWWEAILSLIATTGIVLLALRWPAGNELLAGAGRAKPVLSEH